MPAGGADRGVDWRSGSCWQGFGGWVAWQVRGFLTGCGLGLGSVAGVGGCCPSPHPPQPHLPSTRLSSPEGAEGVGVGGADWAWEKALPRRQPDPTAHQPANQPHQPAGRPLRQGIALSVGRHPRPRHASSPPPGESAFYGRPAGGFPARRPPTGLRESGLGGPNPEPTGSEISFPPWELSKQLRAEKTIAYPPSDPTLLVWRGTRAPSANQPASQPASHLPLAKLQATPRAM